MDDNLFGDPGTSQDDLMPEAPDVPIGDTGHAGNVQISTPRDNPCLIGHDTIIDQLLDWHDRNALPHALIFTGPRGIGKATAAYALARTLLKDNEAKSGGDDATDSLFGGEDVTAAETVSAKNHDLLMDSTDPVFRKVAAQSHPDCLDIARGYDEKKQKPKTALDVHQVRHVQDFLHMRASVSGGRKIAIIDEGETMNRNAQNALLKVLEEPPGNTLLIIIADQLGALLPTIRSRVRVMHFTPLQDGDMQTLLRANCASLSEDELHMIVEIAEGAVGPALELAGEEGRTIMRQTVDCLKDWPDISWPDIYKLSAYLNAQKDSEARLRIFGYIMTWFIQHILRIKTRNISPISELDTTDFQNALARTHLDQVLQICDNLKSHFDSAYQAHLDKHYIVEGAFATLINHKREAA